MKKRTTTRRAVARTAPRGGKGAARRTTAPARRSLKPLVAPDAVFPTLRQHMLIDGFDIIIDLKKSRGSFIVDARTGKLYLDFFTFVASSPVGLNHPMMTSADFQKRLAYAAVNKPSLSDIYTNEQADFLATFSRVAIPPYLPHAFFIEGGSAAVENALKTAFDWKIRKNFARGLREERGRQIIHFQGAFHGRGGYTLSLTNTDPVKVDLFPKFSWPRVPAPAMRFPMTAATTASVEQEEQRSIAAIKQAFHDNPDDIAAIIIEPIQGEGGDRQFRPEFFRALRQLADENEALLIADEVQTGVAMTGKMWAHQHYIEPDIISFGKKMQVCGILCGKRIDDVKDNVFAVPSRINSTWGGNLVDMVRAQRYLEIIEKEKLVDNARVVGAHLLQRLQELVAEFPDLFANARGLGLFAAFDVVTPEKRTEIREAAFDLGLIILPSGERSIRFRPPLNVSREEIDLGIEIIRKTLTK